MQLSLGYTVILVLIIGGVFLFLYFLISQATNQSPEKEIEKLQEEDKYKDISINKITDSDKILAIIGYFGPLFLIPLFLKQKNDFCQFHARQGIILFVLFIILWVLYLFLSFILPEFIAFIFQFLFAVIIIGFISVGIFNVMTLQKNPLPIISNYISLD